MNPGRGFSIPGENKFIQIPATPEKPFLQSEMPQNQAIESENWQDLLGIYTGLLQNNAPSQKINQNTLVAQNHNFNPNRLNHTQTVTPVETSKGHFRNFNPTGHIQLDTQEYLSSNHKEGMQNPPRKVDSLAELMGMKRVTSNGIAYRSTNVVNKPVIIYPHSQGESNMKDYASLGVMNQNEQRVVHAANHDIAGYNLQETPNSRLSASYWPNYNLNLPQRSEAGEPSSSSRSFPLGPLTPDQQKQSENRQVIQVPHLSIDKMSIPEKCTQDNIFSYPQPEILEKDHNELLKNNSEGGNGGIDLNKTPQQKTPKRKKHRPKVVVEGKQKRTQKPAAEKDNTPPKRKYSTKNGVKTSKNPSTYPENVVEASEVDPPKKSCKRALNFDLDNGAETESLGREFDNNERNKRHFNLNLNLDSQNAEWSTENINTYGKEKQQTEIAYSFIHSENRSPPQESLQLEAKTPPPTYKDRALNVIARSIYMRNASVNKPIDLMGSQLWSPHSISNSNKMWQTGFETGKKTRVEDKFHGTSSSIPSDIRNDDFSGQTESRENKSLHSKSSIMHQNGGLTNSNNKLTDTCDWYMASQDQRDKFQWQNTSSQVQFRAEQMAQKTYHGHAKEQIVNSLTTVTNCSKSIPTNEIISPPDRVAVKKRTAGQTSSKKVSIMDRNLQHSNDNTRSYGHSTKKVTGSQDKRDLYVDYLTDRMKDLHINGKGKKIVRKEQNALVPFRGDNSAVVPYEEFNPVKKRIPRPRVDLDPETNRLWNLLMGKEGCESAETMDNDKRKWWEEERKVFRGRADSFIARMHLVQGDRRFSKWKGSVVDSVIGVFLTQNVSDHLSSSAFMSLAAKFPLKSRTMSTSVEQHEVRITFPDETTSSDNNMTRESVCNHRFAISKETSTQEEGNYMKGVISSQSSSESPIFQASEDIKSSSGSNSEIEDGWNINKNQSYQTVSKQAERIAAFQQFQLQFMKNPIPNKRPLSCHQQLENPVYNQNLGPARISNPYSHPFVTSMPIHHSSAAPSTNSHPNMSTGLEEWESRILALSGKEGISSLASTVDLITSSISLGHPHNNVGQAAEISFTERPNLQPSTVNHAIPSKHVELQIDLSDGSQNRNGQHFIKQRQGRTQESSQQNSVFPADPTRPAEVFGTQPSGNVQKYPNEDIISDNRKHTDNITLKPKTMGKVHSSGKPSSKTNTTTPNERKRKAEKEKAEPFNWDTLRKQAQSMAGTRERSREAKDSLDYEALRNADVREISDTIKERGMNNMLAERIKDFLNRLVRDHEKVDLEWLRDVQPDKAKDYLLSVRGLGLKSVECVRLLTLHHLAFPVDTNVGRIAVRLGWVPLQPLPESLQLHLLEMYPVLDSIQKYLWPRLCKLDQETLYELHYQMITFGKVFCTKREPNCNACPMRAECRHFASAFASARLALPGPDERRIVTSVAPTTENKRCDAIIKPIALLPGEDNLQRGMGSKGSCEPLIEEPTTPEPPIEVSERDIEDAFYEDPDEIPVIKLNVEEFTTNLQSFMQEHMEMGEGDMSRALVALSPELASLPTSKLKHVSRLRTEHQVYELPDSHPLLKGMDRREPDDPSPYLLAIWTPGETADSVQPPESTCTCASQEGGGMCNKTTCFACNSVREAQAQTVRGTILIPCRTAMRGSFPLNGTYFQVNEVFADHESSLSPIDVPRSLLWNLPRRTVFFGTSVTTIFKGLSTEDIQFCFWKGFVCVRGFDQKTRAPRPLKARLHLPASKMVKQNE